MENQLLESCIQYAHEVGSPADQVQQFLTHGYVPSKFQWQFHSAAREADHTNGPVQIGLGGARGPGKSHGIFSQIALDDCLRQPNLKALFLRQTGKAAKESMDDLVVRVLAKKVQYEHTSSVLRFPNGSKVILGGFKDEKDIDKYVGIEYDVIGIEEENQLSEQKVEMLRGSLRTSKPNWRPRLYASFNPGGIGHGYVKKTFVEPYRAGLERETRFIPATYRDNPNLNVEYIQYLEGLTGQLGQAWRDGDFDILAGTYFTEWREHIHVCRPFDIPMEWRKFCSLDYGMTAPLSLAWWAISPDKQLFRYRELYQSGLTYSRLAEEYVARTPHGEKIEYLVGDPSIWNTDGRSDEGLSGAEIFERRVNELTKNSPNKCPRLERGNNDRITGLRVIKEYLRPYQTKDSITGNERITAKLQVFDTCQDFIRTIPLQIHDDNNPEDIDTDLEDHAIDDTKYAVLSRPSPASTPEQIAKREFELMLKKKKGLMKKEKPLRFQKRI